ncbi:hypothetical protein JCM11641_004367 [Rhodosporidiobolus odoratus]
MTAPRILISGAGIGGPLCAFWLARAGIRTTVIEAAPSLRTSGQSLDINGSAARTVIDRSGLWDVLNAAASGEEGTHFVDGQDRRWASFVVGKGPTNDPEIVRWRIAHALVEASKKEGPGTEYVFGDRIVGLDDLSGKDGVSVTFKSGKTSRYDAVVLADGMYSKTRSLLWPDEDVTYRHLGPWCCYFSIPYDQAKDGLWSRLYPISSRRSIWLRPDPKTPNCLAALIVGDFEGAGCDPVKYRALSRDEQKKVWIYLYKGAGWETERVMEGLAKAEDFYSGPVAQVRIPYWGKGRIVLTGDAAHAPSPMTGMGTSCAITGAYVLAGELAKRASTLHDPTSVTEAFTAYESIMRPHVEFVQATAPSPQILKFVFPSSAIGVAAVRAFAGVASAVLKLPWEKLKEHASFTDVHELKLHLRVLAAFHQLRQNVEAESGGWAGHLEPKARWSCFVNVAVGRLADLAEVMSKDASRDVPVLPLDVMLVLHTYQLNPSCSNSIDPNKLCQLVEGKDETVWQELTNTRFDPYRCFAETKGRIVQDPKTSEPYTVPWINAAGTGYAQQGFSFAGPHGETWTHESMGIQKLAQDMRACCNDPQQTLAQGLQLHAHPVLRLGAYLATIMGVNRSGARATLVLALGRTNQKAADNILSYYTRGEPFSLDLATAVLRQGTFIEKMHDLGWLDPSRFASDDTLPNRSIARYHAFMDLLSGSSSSVCVPTLDIDLVWHTHQLTSHYREDVDSYVGRFVDHDDKVEENALATGFDDTAKAWQARFGVPYFRCGCPPPPTAASLSRLTSRLTSRQSSSFPPGTISPLPSALSTLDFSEARATHASEHNALCLPNNSEASEKREKRMVEVEGRRRKEEKSKKGNGTGEAVGHEAAFLAAVPLGLIYGSAGYPIPAGGCCSLSGNISGGTGGFASSGGAWGLSPSDQLSPSYRQATGSPSSGRTGAARGIGLQSLVSGVGAGGI